MPAPDLTGAWRIKRRFLGQNLRVSGNLRIDADGRYAERNIGTHGGYRDYIYQRDGNIVRLLFPDGRLFLELRFENGQARGRHVCGDDVYEAFFRVRRTRWMSVYKVTGPRKNYTMVSVMSRMGS